MRVISGVQRRMLPLWLTGLLALQAAGEPASDPGAVSITARAANGHGLLCRVDGRPVLMVGGTPEQMGAAHGELLSREVTAVAHTILYTVGAAYTLREGTWYFSRMDEILRRTAPHTPPRFIDECDAMSRAAGISVRDGRYANFFPEMFHCSGVAVRGKASKGGRVLHARVLDYMRDIDFQRYAYVTVYLPQARYRWMTLGIAGFIGTVTAMNEQGVAVGEMGGRGEGQWDGMPMSFLLRDVMERAATVEEALAIMESTPRTCEYYYVLSDKAGTLAGVYGTPGVFEVLQPGQQDERLPLVPEDTVLFSGDKRAVKLSERLQASYGEIDVQTMIEIIKRPVAMKSNLHNAIFAPETLDMWYANAGKHTPACDEPYARCNLADLLRFWENNAALEQL